MNLEGRIDFDVGLDSLPQRWIRGVIDFDVGLDASPPTHAKGREGYVDFDVGLSGQLEVGPPKHQLFGRIDLDVAVSGELIVASSRELVGRILEDVTVDCRFELNVPLTIPSSLQALPAPGAPTIATTTQPEGSLAATPGTYSYRVAAYQVDTSNATTAGPESSFAVTTQPNLRVTWAAVTGADGYLLYVKAPGSAKYLLLATTATAGFTHFSGGGKPPEPADRNYSAILVAKPDTIMRRSQKFDLPAYGPFNVPRDWQPTSEVIEPWGRLAVILAGADRSFFRGVPCIIDSWESTEPYDDSSCSLRFPQISWYEYPRYGSGLHWLAEATNCTIRRVRPDGTSRPEDDLFNGFVASAKISGNAGHGITLQCMGALHQANYTAYPPEVEPVARDVGDAIADILDSVVSRNYALCNRPATGLITSQRGGWGTRLDDGVTPLLATAYTDDGKDQWTVMLDVGRRPVIRLKDKTTRHWTVTLGAPGVKPDLQDDLMANTNVVYGEGTDPAGFNWRGLVYPNDAVDVGVGAAPFYRPLHAQSDLEPFLYDAAGNRTGKNPDFDSWRMRIERYINYGEGTYRGFAEKDARQVTLAARQGDPNWVGSLVLDADPEEGSRYDMRAGQNVWLKLFTPPRRFWKGGILADADDGILLHISRCSVVPGGAVTCEVSYLGHDFQTLAALRGRQRDSSDRARRPVTGRRVSKQTVDTKTPSDDSGGAGIISAFNVPAGAWAVKKIPMGEHALVKTAILTATPAVRFAAAVFGKPVEAAQLNAVIRQPLRLGGNGINPWRGKGNQLAAWNLQIAWGGPGQAAGYYPGLESEGAAVTGQFRDDGVWHYSTRTPPYLYVAVWAEAACSISGRLYEAPQR